MNEIDLQTPSELLIEVDHRLESGAAAISALIRSQDTPSAVICSNDVTAGLALDRKKRPQRTNV